VKSAVPPAPNCLELVWSSGGESDKQFDIDNDRKGDDSISCSTLTSPSAFQNTFSRVRTSAKRGDEQALVNLVDYPLTFIDRSGEHHLLTKEDLLRSPQAVFQKEVLDILRNLQMRKMHVVRNKGGFFASGAIWFQVRSVGGQPKIGTINHQALRKTN
jgi:hypothetical protein